MKREQRAAIVMAVIFTWALALFPFFGGQPLNGSEVLNPGTWSHRVFWEFRFPRILLSLSGGGLLAVLGGSYQILFANSLCEPYMLGISTAVTLGLLLGKIFLNLATDSISGMILGAGTGVILSLVLILVDRKKAGFNTDRLVLFGVGANFLLSAVLFLLLSYYSAQLNASTLWFFFGGIPWSSISTSLLFLVFTLIILAVILVYSRALDAISLGDPVARTLGIHPERVRSLLLLLTSFAVSVSVVMTGTVGFVGLTMPHLARALFRPQGTREGMLYTFAMGALFLGFGDVASRTLYPPFEFPIGVMTAALGGPVFLYLLWKR